MRLSEPFPATPIQRLDDFLGNQIYIKRDDLFPLSFGGNKARKAVLFFQEIERQNSDAVVTYGSAASNHCRVVANLAAALQCRCLIISPEGANDSFNRQLCAEFGAEFIACPLDHVSATIDQTMAVLRAEGSRPFFIPGGGHGNLGTRAYDLVCDEIAGEERRRGLRFDYIFLASGTGTTQAGLICGSQRLGENPRRVVGISIARQLPRGAQVILESVREYRGEGAPEDIVFVDRYIEGGYGQFDDAISKTIRDVMRRHGVPLDPTYTGKAFCGMRRFLQESRVNDKNVLFIHTGGTPIFFDWLEKTR